MNNHSETRPNIKTLVDALLEGQTLSIIDQLGTGDQTLSFFGTDYQYFQVDQDLWANCPTTHQLVEGGSFTDHARGIRYFDVSMVEVNRD